MSVDFRSKIDYPLQGDSLERTKGIFQVYNGVNPLKYKAFSQFIKKKIICMERWNLLETSAFFEFLTPFSDVKNDGSNRQKTASKKAFWRELGEKKG